MIKHIFLLLFIVSSFLYSQTNEQVQDKPISPEKKANILKVLKAAYIEEEGAERIEMLLDEFKRLAPLVPDNFWEKMRKEIDSKEFALTLIPIYDTYFTNEELLDILKFFQSSTGSKWVKSLPFIANESYEITSQWEMQIGQKIVQALKDDGFINTNQENQNTEGDSDEE